MATGYIPLKIGSASLPDGSTGNLAAGIVLVQSSAAAPSPHFLQAIFDAASDEFIEWTFQMPDNYASGLTLRVPYKMASATTGDVIFQAYVAAVSDGDSQDVDAKAFGTVNTSSAVTVPGTAGHPDVVTFALSNLDSLAAGDWVVLRLGRDGDNGSDTATGDLEMLDVMATYTTT